MSREKLRDNLVQAYHSGKQIAIYQGGCVWLGRVVALMVLSPSGLVSGITLGYQGVYGGMIWHKEFLLGEWPSWRLCGRVYGEYTREIR